MRLLHRALLAALLTHFAVPLTAAEVSVEASLRQRLDRERRLYALLPGNFAAFTDRLEYAISNIHATGTDITIGSVVANAIPGETIARTYYTRNCTHQPEDRTQQISITVEEGVTAVVSRAVTLSQDLSASINISKLTAGTKASTTVNLSHSTTTSQRETRTSTETVRRTIAPMTEVTIDAQRRVSSAYVPFRGVVVVEADVVITGWSALGLNLEPPKGPGGGPFKLSGLYTESRECTFEVAGELWNASAEDTRVTAHERVLTDEFCRSIATQLGSLAPTVKVLTAGKSAPASISDFMAPPLSAGSLRRYLSAPTNMPLGTGSPNCEYEGVKYNEGAIVCVEGQMCKCRDGAWDIVKPYCDTAR